MFDIIVLFISIPILIIIVVLLFLYEVKKFIIFAFILVYVCILFYAIYKILQEQKKKVIECEKNRDKNKNETKQKISEVTFKMCFGFDPARMSEHRNQKEVLIKLSIIASKLNECSLKIANNNNIWNRMQYSEFLARYQTCIEHLEKHCPEFAANLPHWTELSDFVKNWSSQKNKT